MATFTITTTQNIDEITGKAGGDTYNINGGTLTIDQHSRFGLNNNDSGALTSTSMGPITISSTLGGTLNIDGRYVRMIPFDGGSGTIPVLNSLVTQGSASGKLMCVYSSLTSVPLVEGGAMPASGWIQIKQWNSIEYTSGALTISGLTANATGPSTVGFLEIFGDDTRSLTAVRLGTVNITGEWYSLGTTTGVSNQTLQIPNHGTLKHIAGVYIEKTSGQKDYEFYPNAGTAVTIGTDSYRGKVVWISNTGLVRIGNSGSATNGYTPVSGLEVVIPNILLQCCLLTARNAEVIPHATIASRFDFTTTGGGVVNADKANFAWYPSFAQAYSIQLSNCGIIDQIAISECASACNWNNVGVGNKPTVALTNYALSLSFMFAGGTFTDCVWTRVAMGASGAHSVYMADINGFTFLRNTIRANTIRAHSTTYSATIIRAVNCIFTEPSIIQGPLYFTTCSNITATDTKFASAVQGTTVTSYTGGVAEFASNSLNCTISGLTFPVTNTHPYTTIFQINAAGCSNIKFRNIGTRAIPLTCGSTNASAYLLLLGTGAAATDIKAQRCYIAQTRSGLWSSDNSSTGVTIENCAGDYADVPVVASLNMMCRATGCSTSVTAQTSIYGSHFVDCFTSTTAGRIMLRMNEKTSIEPSASTYTITSGDVKFTSAGGLYMPTIGMQIEYTMPYYALGHTSFANSLPVMAGGTLANYTVEFKIDKNDGNGFSANWTTATAANLFAISGINASLGFKLKVRITTAVTNTTAITSLYFTTVSTTTAQDYQYPLDVATLTFTGLVAGTEIHAYLGTDPATVTELASTESSGTSYSFSHSAGGSAGYVTFIKPGYTFLNIPLTYSATNTEIPVFQNIDRSYSNPV